MSSIVDEMRAVLDGDIDYLMQVDTPMVLVKIRFSMKVIFLVVSTD